MALIDLITPGVVKNPLESSAKEDVIRELIQVLKDAGKIAEVEPVFDAIMAREAQGSTGLADGIAIPHAKIPAVKTLTAALGISPSGVDFDALDGKPSHLFFLILAAPDQSGPHIEALAEIARLTRSKSFCDMLTHAGSAEEVVQLLEEG
jgi:mannitol/fructose-specific phosphotransferase system IIA component (Ntr-type)